MNKQERRLFTKEFKMQMVKLYESGKRVSDIAKEYDLNEPNVYHWIRQYKNTQSFSTKDNLTPEEKELILLRKRNKQLEMENDILKQAALIMGRK